MTTLSFSLQILKKEEAIPWPGTLAIVHSYIAYKEGDFRLSSSLTRLLGPNVQHPHEPFCFVAAKEEEKQKLMKWSSELKLEREQLEQRVKQLSNSITVRNAVKAAQQRGDKSRLLSQSSVRFMKYTESGANRSLVAAFADVTNVNIGDYIS